MLTPEQVSAAHSDGKVILCSAAAGSGKSSVLVERIQWLLQNAAKPEDICAITFTTTGAKVITERVDLRNWIGITVDYKIQKHDSALVDVETRTHSVRLGFTGTLHSLLFKLIRQHHEKLSLPAELTVMSEEDADQMLLGIAQSLKVKASLSKLKWEVAGSFSANEIDYGMSGKIGIVSKEFIRQMRQSGELSYDALLSLGHKLIKEHPEVVTWKHALIDECQDGCDADWKIYSAMNCESAFYVGDNFQRIFSFRGASDGFERLATVPNVTIKSLSTNFRCSKNVVQASNQIAAHMGDKLNVPATARPDAPEGMVTLTGFDTAAEEIAFVVSVIAQLPQDQTAAVLLRTNKACEVFAQALAPFGLFAARTGTVMTPDEKLALAMLRAMCAPHNDRVVLKMIEVASGIVAANKVKSVATEQMVSASSIMALEDVSGMVISDPVDIGMIVAKFISIIGPSKLKPSVFVMAELATQLPLPCTLQDLLLLAQQPEPEQNVSARVSVKTIHSAKGQEFSTVILPCFEDEVIPGKKVGEDLCEERRIAYVGVTRAKLNCHISWARQRPNEFTPWKIETRTVSRFATEAMAK